MYDKIYIGISYTVRKHNGVNDYINKHFHANFSTIPINYKILK
jgi:hypothetical protein